MLIYHKNFYEGLLALTVHSRECLDITFNKLHQIHHFYLANNPALYSMEEKKILNNRLSHVIDKFFFASISMEQLHSLKLGKINFSLNDIIQKNINSLNYSNNESLISSYLLENFLFQARSFLNIYKIYLCLILKTGYKNQMMKKDVFFKLLKKVPPELKPKADLVSHYFENNVFREIYDDPRSIYREDWGSILVALRDKIAHKDILIFQNESNERIANNILINSPSINSIPLHQFVSTINNEMHKLFHDLLCNIFEVNWDDY